MSLVPSRAPADDMFGAERSSGHSLTDRCGQLHKEGTDMITVREIKRIVESPEYQCDLEELSSYAESIMQERPMVLLLSKYLCRQGHKLELEYRRKLEQKDRYRKQYDLVVDGTLIEFKFHYDWHIGVYLEKELAKYKPDSLLWEAVRDPKKINPGWSVTPHICKDVLEKKPDIFVWIICARNLDDVKDDDLRPINDNHAQKNFNKNGNPYGSTKFLAPVDSLLGKLKKRRGFSDEMTIIATDGHFPSTYYLKLCEFERNH